MIRQKLVQMQKQQEIVVVLSKENNNLTFWVGIPEVDNSDNVVLWDYDEYPTFDGTIEEIIAVVSLENWVGIVPNDKSGIIVPTN